MVSCGYHKLWMLNSQMPWAWGSATETPTEALTKDPCSLSTLNSSFFSVPCHLGQQTEGSIWCIDPKHVTLRCARTSVLPEAGTADQLAKQVCQCVKIPANSFPRFLEYYTTSFNLKAFCPCKLATYEGNWLCSQPTTNYFSSPQLHQVLQKDVQNPWPEASGFGEAHTWTVPELLLLLPPSQNTAFTQLTQHHSRADPDPASSPEGPVWPLLILSGSHGSLPEKATHWMKLPHYTKPLGVLPHSCQL